MFDFTKRHIVELTREELGNAHARRLAELLSQSSLHLAHEANEASDLITRYRQAAHDKDFSSRLADAFDDHVQFLATPTEDYRPPPSNAFIVEAVSGPIDTLAAEAAR